METCSDAAKKFIVEQEWKPPHNFIWPTSTHREKGQEKIRRLTSHSMNKHPWLAYSTSKAGLFCRFCVLFAKNSVGTSGVSAGTLVSKPLTRYVKLTDQKGTGILDVHSSRKYHENAVQDAANFANAMNDRQKDIGLQLDRQAARVEEETRKNLKPIIKLITVCGKQNIPLRGHRDSGRVGVEHTDNEGNFRALLRYRAEVDQDLREHLESAPNNALYVSPRIQNEIIDCIGSLMEAKVVNSVRQSTAGQCFSILADETTDISCREQLSIFVRHVSDEGQLKEDFLGFVDVHDEVFDLNFANLTDGEVLEPKVTGKQLGRTIVTAIEKAGLDISACVGQGYDGASMMASDVKGAATVLLEKKPAGIVYSLLQPLPEPGAGENQQAHGREKHVRLCSERCRLSEQQREEEGTVHRGREVQVS